MARKAKLSRKKIRGGTDNKEIPNIIQALLEMNEILFLPGTQTILSKNYDKYLSSIDSKTLLHLVQNNNMVDVDPIKEIFGGPINDDQKLIDDQSQPLTNNIELIKPDISNLKENIYYSQFLSLNDQIDSIDKELGSLKERIKVDNYKLRNFKCIKGLNNQKNDYLMKYILDCADSVNKNNNWYNIIINEEELDSAFNIEVTKKLNENGVKLDEDKVKQSLKLLKDNKMLKEIFSKKLLTCSKIPNTYFEELRGIISFKSLEDCQTCSNEDCLLYLNDNYRSFLMEEGGLSISQKIKLLIYCEFRIYLFSKYLTIEAKRINDKNYDKVNNILSNLKSKDKENLTIKKNRKNSIEKRKENLESLEEQKKTKQLEFNKLLDKSSEQVNNTNVNKNSKGFLFGGNTNDNLMKQNILSQILQVINNDDSSTSELDMKSLGKIDKPFGQGLNKPFGQALNKPFGQGLNKPFGQGDAKPSGQGDAKPFGQGPNKPFGQVANKPFGQGPNKPFGQVANKPFGQGPNKPFGQSANKPFGQGPNKPFGQSDAKPFGQSDAKPFGQGPNKPFGQGPNKPFGQGPNKPFSQAENKPFGQSVNKPFGQSANKPFGQGPNKPFGQGPNKPFGQGPNKPFVQGPNKPSSQSVNKPFVQGPNKPSSQSVNKPFGQSVNKPFGQDIQRPMSNPNQKLSLNKFKINIPPKVEKKVVKFNVNPVQVEQISSKNLEDDILPDCTAISKDILSGKIRKKNFNYLTSRCDEQIRNALMNS